MSGGTRRGLDSLLAWPWAYLNRLLQYLHGRVLGFCCLPSAISSALPEMVAVSTDRIDCMSVEVEQARG